MTPVREALKEAIDVLEGMNDDEINLELLPRLKEALSAAPGEPCAVKPLEWTGRNADGSIHIAYDGPVQYWAWELAGYGYWSWGALAGREVHGGLDAAKAAAQADYEQRIRSALVTTPQPAAGWDEDHPYDDERFNRGVQHVVNLIARELGATDWVAGDGSEDYDCDLWQTILNILAAKGIYDADEGEFAALRREAPAPAERVKSLHGMIAAIYGSLDAEDCAWIDREWAKMRGYILPTDGTNTIKAAPSEARLREAFEDVLSRVFVFRDHEPEEDETWESWYYAAFDLLTAEIKAMQRKALSLSGGDEAKESETAAQAATSAVGRDDGPMPHGPATGDGQPVAAVGSNPATATNCPPEPSPPADRREVGMESMLGRPYGQEKGDVTCMGSPCGWPTCDCGRV